MENAWFMSVYMLFSAPPFDCQGLADKRGIQWYTHRDRNPSMTLTKSLGRSLSEARRKHTVNVLQNVDNRLSYLQSVHKNNTGRNDTVCIHAHCVPWLIVSYSPSALAQINDSAKHILMNEMH